jgi:hypothetical protein
VSEIHDHYHRWSQAHDVVYLNGSRTHMDGVDFCGATGWHDFQAGAPISTSVQIQTWLTRISDSHNIDWGEPSRANNWKRVLLQAHEDAQRLQALAKCTLWPKVLITHHIPHRQLVKTTADPAWNALNGSFCNTQLENVQDPSIRVWCFGHTHFMYDKDIGSVRYVCNPRGYRGENPNWQPQTIEVSTQETV